MNDLELAQHVVKQASAHGAAAEVYISSGGQTEVQVRAGDVEKLSYAGSKGLGLRVLIDGRMGYAYTSDFSEASLNETIASALELAEISDPDPHRALPDPQPIPEDDLGIYDSTMEKIEPAAKVDFQKAVEAAALAVDERIKMAVYNTYMDGIQQITLVNSNGFSGSYRTTFAGAYIMVMAMDEADRAMGLGYSFGRSLAELDPAQIGRDAGELALRLLGGKPVQTQVATVVYTPYAVSSLLAALSQAVTAKAMQRQRSFLQGKMGETVASDMVTLLDNGRLPGGFATRPFDDEGNPTSATRLIDEGVFQAVLYDEYSARKDGQVSTGNATRAGHNGPPGLAASNFYIQPGHLPAEELIQGVEKGLYVFNVMNTHSINPINGDYSVSAQGFWIEKGKITHPVNGVTIALPLQEWLHNVSQVADDLTFIPVMGAIGAPTIRVDGVTIGGL